MKLSVIHCEPRAPGPWKETGKEDRLEDGGIGGGGIVVDQRRFRRNRPDLELTVTSTAPGACGGASAIEGRRPPIRGNRHAADRQRRCDEEQDCEW